LRPALQIGVLVVGSSALVPFAIVRLAMRAWYASVEGGMAGLSPGPGVEQFAPLAWGFGLMPTSGVAQGWEASLWLPWTVSVISLGLLVASGVVALVGFRQLAKERAWPVFGAVVGAGALLLLLRFVVPYPYGYFKLLPSAAPFLLLLPALGLEALAPAL